MINNKRVLSIIPARMGSVGLPGKNVKVIGGKPMIAHSIEKALSIKEIDRVIVSTEDEAIAGIARKYGAETPFLRDKKLATNSAPLILVIADAIKRMEKAGERFDYVLVLQANSPLTKIADIYSVIKKIVEEELDAVFTVCKVDHPSQWTLRIKDSIPEFAFIDGYDRAITHRQAEETLYRSTGAAFAGRVEYILNNMDTARLCLPGPKQKRGVVITDSMSSIDIDNELDFYVAEAIFKLKRVK
ncbi:MAG: acylneuraminate cytidylyltransferase family protein [Candidatus Omnitrophota bacterium]|nr:acylneuraminate cytidylyltransferase family protein [Candidatus Omnitrophota bacterium]